MVSSRRVELARNELQALYAPVKDSIEARLEEFRSIWNSRDEAAILKELLFCILTPQSKAKACWSAIDEMSCSDLLMNGSYEDVLSSIGSVRFKYKKAGFLIEARERFGGPSGPSMADRIASFPDNRSARNWFAENVKGIGYKEAGHFLRNIGLGRDIAILDRHILRNLAGYGVIDEVPSSINRKLYLDIEIKMEEFSGEIGIPMDRLDLLLWYKEAGDVFK